MQRVVVLYSTRLKAEQVLLDELRAMAQKQRGRLRVVTTVTGKEGGGDMAGRVTPQMLATVFPWHDADRGDVRFLASGTKEMISGVDRMLATLGYVKEQYELIRSNVFPQRQQPASP